jgi:hypothetical protein
MNIITRTGIKRPILEIIVLQKFPFEAFIAFSLAF